MSRLDPDARVYAEEITDLPIQCMWFALCDHYANGLRRGPIGDGEFGDIPICRRCDDKCERLSYNVPGPKALRHKRSK